MAPSAVESDLAVGKVKKKSRWDIQPDKRNKSLGETSTLKMDTNKIDCNQCETNSNNDQSRDSEKGDERPSDEAEPIKFTCEVCEKWFLKKNSLRRHIMTHIQRSEFDSSSLPTKAFICDVEGCKYESNHLNNFKRHNLKVHLSLKEKPSKTMHRCSKCERKFADVRNLRFHMRKVHDTGDLVLEIKRQCPLCPFTSTEHDKNQIHAHFENDHGIPMVWEAREFSTMGEFINWKHTTEKLTTTSYVRSYCTPSLLSFQCHRSGSYKKKGFDKRRLKEIGSCKINAFCPSAITVKVFENNVVCASYLATHIGHTNEPEHIRMTPEERAVLGSQHVRRRKPSNQTPKRVKNKTSSQENATNDKRSNAEIEMEKLMLEVQQDMEENPDPPEHAIFLEHVADVHPSSVECLNLPHGTVENCQITVLTALEPTVISCIDLQEEKDKFLGSFIRCINESVQTLDDLEYVRQHCQAILPTLRDPGPLIAQSGCVMPQPGCVITQPDCVITQPGCVITQPNCEGQVSVITQLAN